VSAAPGLLSDEARADIQGFITSGYGPLRSAAYLFVRLHDAAAGRRWLAELSASVTSSRPWPTSATGRRKPARPAINIAFTADGLMALRLPEDVLCSFPTEFQEGIVTPPRSSILGDTEESAPDRWELGGPHTEAVHAIVLIHAETDDELEGVLASQRALITHSSGGVAEVSLQRGRRPMDDYEPFGFHDGIGQPDIRGFTKPEGVPTGEFILGYLNHYGLIPPPPVVPARLDPDGLLPSYDNPHHPRATWRDLGRHGSFLVYRKLQQDVAGFWAFMRNESMRVKGVADPVYMVRLAAKCVGRWPGGASLALSPDLDNPALADNDHFSYRDDPDGHRCPLGAHVRRSHPRDWLHPYGPEKSLSMSEAHRLLRRARVYGPGTAVTPKRLQAAALGADRTPLTAAASSAEPRGIHFFCVNASIKSQFEFVQQTWCNNPRFSGLNDNKDPIVGDHGGAGERPSHMTIPGEPRTAPLPRFVTVKGGAYFFMPSVTALRYLASTTWTR
jgi:Dyp-type peroxidase family